MRITVRGIATKSLLKLSLPLMTCAFDLFYKVKITLNRVKDSKKRDFLHFGALIIGKLPIVPLPPAGRNDWAEKSSGNGNYIHN